MNTNIRQSTDFNGWIGIGHRGAPRDLPANTLRGFQRAVELGCAMVECDVRQAADGVLVLAHDAHVRDITGCRYGIVEHSSAALSALDLGGGEGVPNLTELAVWAQGRCAVMADMKCEGDGVEEGVIAALAPLSPESKIVPGAGPQSRKRFKECDPSLPLSLTMSVQESSLLEGDGFQRLLDSLDTAAVTWEHPLLSAPRIAALHARGLRVYAWTVDDLLTMRHLVDDGVDGIITNHPDLLSQIKP